MKKLVPFLVVGLVIRLILMAGTLHPDIRGHNLAAYLIAQKGHVLDLYDYLSRQPRDHPWVLLYRDDLFIYPPLAYLTHALFNLLLHPFYPQNLFQILLTDIGRVYDSPGLGWLLILLKTPYLVADIMCLVILRRLVTGKHQHTTSILWIFNPVTIYAGYMIGQFDIFIALFILLALLFPAVGPIMLGLGAGFKPFPLFLAPFLPGSKVRNISLTLVTYLLVILAYLPSSGFRMYALAAPQTDKLSFAKIMVSGSQYLPLFFVGLVGLFWWNWYSPKSLPSWGWLTAVCLIFYSLSHFHPQWFVWVTPMLILSLILKPVTRFPILILSGSSTLLLLLFEPSLNFGLFHIDFNLFSWINRFYPADQFASVVRGVFAATSAAVVFGARNEA